MRKANQQWLSIAVTTALSLTAIAQTARAESPTTTELTPTTIALPVADSPAVQRNIHAMNLDTRHPELVAQLQSKKGGTVKFWEAVAWCETNHKWNDGGYYSGGLGMAKSVWLNYGGRQFAPSPKSATKEEQIIVANRVVFFGFQTKNIYASLEDKQNNKPFFRPAMGWRHMKNWGKDCVNWRTRKPARDRYTEEGMAEWKKSRAPKTAVKPAGLAGSVSAQSVGVVKRCPQWEAQLAAHGLVPVARFSYIMWRESRCQEAVVSKVNRNGTRDYGLLQINSSWRSVTRRICGGAGIEALRSSKCNLRVAKYLFDNGGFRHWSATSGTN